MLRVLCILIPLIVLLLPLFLDGGQVLILNVLFIILGFIFSYVNYRYRKDRIWLIVFIINAVIFLYYIYAVVMFFVN